MIIFKFAGQNCDLVRIATSDSTEKFLKTANEQSDIDSQHVDDIILRDTYAQSACPNDRGFYYIIDSIHLRLLT